MLEAKLKQASESSAKQRRRLLYLFVVVAFIGMAVMLAMPYFKVKISNQTAPQALLLDRPVADRLTTDRSTTDRSITDQSELRQQLMIRLQAYEKELEPLLLDANLKGWNLEKEIELSALKKELTSAFGMADYMAGLDLMARLERLAQETLTERDAIFNAELSMAKGALKQDDYDAGQLHIQKALRLKKAEPEALLIVKQLEALPELLALLKKADVARIENNQQKEYAALAEAYGVAPERAGLKQRRDQLSEQIKEAQFSNLINRVLLNLKKKQIKSAWLDYNKAKALYSNRAELQVLKGAIVKASVAVDLQQAIAAGKQAIAQDDWSKAKLVYTGALQRHPEDKSIRDGLQLAAKLVSLQVALADYIERSERLSSQNIYNAAQDTLIQARVFVSYSQLLKAQISRLKVLLAQLNVEVPVFVKSDDLTYVQVRGVGKVGRTLGREIHLKPGEYTFEGIRAGYKSKLVEVHLPVGASGFKVEVMCDEQI
ncbi:MAG: hypothetical protein R8K49_00080 [Mariprofundaceae bacterium]